MTVPLDTTASSSSSFETRDKNLKNDRPSRYYSIIRDQKNKSRPSRYYCIIIIIFFIIIIIIFFSENDAFPSHRPDFPSFFERGWLSDDRRPI